MFQFSHEPSGVTALYPSMLMITCVLISCVFVFDVLRVLSYQPTVRVPNVQALDPSYLNSTLADYAVPFHPSALASIPTDMQSESEKHSLTVSYVHMDTVQNLILLSFRSGSVFLNSN